VEEILLNCKELWQVVSIAAQKDMETHFPHLEINLSLPRRRSADPRCREAFANL
jgi:hypothetical protein